LIKNILKIMDRSIEITIAIIFILMVVVGGMQVFNRFILNQSLSWSEEFQKFAHIWIVFLTIPVAYNRGAHIGMGVLFNKFPQKLQNWIKFGFDLIWFIFSLALIVYTLRIMEVTQNQHSAGIGIRMDYVYFGLLIGGVYLLIIAIRKIIEKIRHQMTLKSGEVPC